MPSYKSVDAIKEYTFTPKRYMEYINPLRPHDALKHYFTSLKADLIPLQLRVLEREFPWN